MYTNPYLAKYAKYLNAFIVSDFVNHPIHIVDADGNIVFVNNAWCQVYGLTKREVVGKPIQVVLPKVSATNFYMTVDDVQKLEEEDLTTLTYTHFEKGYKESAATRALSEKRSVSMLTDHPKTGSRMIVTSTPIFDEKNEIIFIFTLVQDLSRYTQWQEKLDAEIKKNRLMVEELQHLRGDLQASRIVGNSKAVEDMRTLIHSVAKTDATVLISGESGVGKEVVAKEIYSNSLRNDGPFVTINCAAIPENLLESEMFGHEKGAFTGAVKEKIGLFELAGGGTLLLDEIGEMPLQLQPKLLRVLQEKEFMRVGGTKRIPTDVRIIAATNRNLYQRVQDGAFRSDLYYRLNVIPVKIPSLRERKEDISLLAISFLARFNEKYQKNKTFSKLAQVALESYQWPGNIRELENAVERMVIIGDDKVITHQHVALFIHLDTPLPLEAMVNEESHLTLKEAVNAFEKQLIQDALSKHKTTYKAAEALGTTQPTIVRKAQALGIKDW